MKLTSLLLASLFLFSVFPKCKADDSSIDESEVFLEQTFRSEVCESAEAPPLWRIGDTNLTNTTIIESYFGKVKVGHNDATGDHQSTLILKHVNFTLNGNVLSCSANSILILNYTLVVVDTTIRSLAPNETFRPPVCKTQLAESPPPNWMINGVILNDTTVNSRYNAHVNRSGHDSKGRHQAELIIRSVNATLSGSNVSCTVDNELRRVYILNITGPGEETTTPVTPGAESTAHTDEVVTGTTEASVNEPSSSSFITGIAVSVPTVVLILAGTVVVIVAVCVLLVKSKGGCNICKFKKTRMGRLESDGEHDEERDSVKRAAPPQVSKEQELLLRKRTNLGIEEWKKSTAVSMHTSKSRVR